MTGGTTSTQLGVGGNTSANLLDRRGANNWRMQRYDGRWWYWMPNNQWMYYQDGEWRVFNGPMVGETTSQNPTTTGYRGFAFEGQINPGSRANGGTNGSDGQNPGSIRPSRASDAGTRPADTAGRSDSRVDDNALSGSGQTNAGSGAEPKRVR